MRRHNKQESPTRFFENVHSGQGANDVQRDFLAALESKCSHLDPSEFYLWPRSPIHIMQTKILERVGVSDYEVRDPRSRPRLIISQLERLNRRRQIGPEFSILDIACGDGLILWQVKKYFPEAACFGVDINKGKIDAHEMVQEGGVELYSVPIQELFSQNAPQPFDVLLMLNTYRGWESADLRDRELHLPQLADEWFKKNGRNIVLTVTKPQISKLKDAGFRVQRLGKGEDDSLMVCLTSGSPWRKGGS